MIQDTRKQELEATGGMNQNKRMVLSEMCLKLNIGCGYDPREGFVNIDGRNDLPKVDRVIMSIRGGGIA